MKNKKETRNEFRYNRSTKHMNYIFEKHGKIYVGMGLTTEPTTFGKKNMPLKQNPQKNKTKQAYVRNGIISGKETNYARTPDKRFSFQNVDDKQNVNSKKRNYKNRQRKHNKKR